MGSYADYFKHRPPGRYHENSQTMRGLRERLVHMKITDIVARMAAYPLARKYKLTAWRQDHYGA